MLLYGALDAVMPRFRKIFNEFSLTEQQWRVLRVLWEHAELPFRDLSCATRIPAPSLVGIVDRLSSVGLVERRRSELDRRQVYVLATEKGRDLERRVTPRVVDTYAELRASLDPDTWDQLITGLRQVCAVGEIAANERNVVNE